MWGIGKPKKDVKGEIHESHEDMTDKVLTRIDVVGRDVTIKVHSREDSSLLFKAEYQTEESPRAAHYTAEQIVEAFTKANGLYVHTKLTNVDLPYVGNANKRMR
jgi:predicted RNA-binding protein Jag